MTLKDLLKKRDKIRGDVTPTHASPPSVPPEFTFMRTTTNTQELITPPSFAGDAESQPNKQTKRHSFSRLRSSSNVSTASNDHNLHSEKRLSARLYLRSRTSSSSSIHVPTDLPSISDGAEEAEKEAQWEKRATILANVNPSCKPLSQENSGGKSLQSPGSRGDRPVPARSISSAQGDDDIQEAIRLHESGDLERSTAMFGRLAENNGDAMAQILYGLALRHGWGTPSNPPLAITYLSAAASSTAAIESAALGSGLKRGGAAKGELVLAMYELANSFRHGWGVEKDAVAARSYYETAANLGDTDAMNEVARMYEEGDGGKKDKVSSTTLITTIHGETFRGFEPLDTKTIFRSGNLSIVSPLLLFTTIHEAYIRSS